MGELREVVSVVHAEMDSAWNRDSIQREHVHRWGKMLRDALAGECSANDLNSLAQKVHEVNRKWWIDISTGEPIERNKGEQIALIHSELSECLEGIRKGLPDDHLPHRSMEEVEMADALIRILDYCAGHGLDIAGAFTEKIEYNQRRADHKIENRLAAGGKKF